MSDLTEEIIARFKAKLGPRTSTGCIEYEGTRCRLGYGQFPINKVNKIASRIAWMVFCGPIPKGKLVLHNCDNPPCCNVEHLRLGTHEENMADMVARGRGRNSKVEKTHCKSGHLLSGDNLYINPFKGQRVCRTCMVKFRKKYEERKRHEGIR